jgi:hypothetical protein
MEIEWKSEEKDGTFLSNKLSKVFNDAADHQKKVASRAARNGAGNSL